MEEYREKIIEIVNRVNDLGLMIRLYNLMKLFARNHHL